MRRLDHLLEINAELFHEVAGRRVGVQLDVALVEGGAVGQSFARRRDEIGDQPGNAAMVDSAVAVGMRMAPRGGLGRELLAQDGALNLGVLR